MFKVLGKNTDLPPSHVHDTEAGHASHTLHSTLSPRVLPLIKPLVLAKNSVEVQKFLVSYVAQNHMPSYYRHRLPALPVKNRVSTLPIHEAPGDSQLLNYCHELVLFRSLQLQQQGEICISNRWANTLPETLGIIIP